MAEPYEGDNRASQVDWLAQLAEEIYCEIPLDVPYQDVTVEGLREAGYLPAEMPSWMEEHEWLFVVSLIREKMGAVMDY